MKRLKKLIPIIILLSLLITAYMLNLQKYVSFSYLQAQHITLENWTDENFLLASIIFCICYIIAVAISMPGAAILTIAGGFLFGIILGTIYVVVSATIGAVIIFLAAKTALGDWLKEKANSYKLEKFSQGFEENAFNYLIVLRLIPLLPFWLVNIVPAFFNIRTSIFITSTFLGIIPGSFVYVLIGNGISSIIAQNKQPNLGIIFEPYILMPLIGLSILSILPVIYKKLKASRSKSHANKES